MKQVKRRGNVEGFEFAGRRNKKRDLADCLGSVDQNPLGKKDPEAINLQDQGDQATVERCSRP